MAHAQVATVPISTSEDYQSTMNYQKNFTLDKIAVTIAKQLLHMLTASIVNWINTGFKGSPSFIQNPEAFFLDAADQVTGAFISNSGPLSALCSPYSIDIRLSLALSLSQPAFSYQRYTCTLSKIIATQKQGTSITVNGKQVGSTVGGFVGGDFTQGGWPAFISMTTEPQNNPYGAVLTAQSDLSAKIAMKQNSIHADLSLGAGFLSSQTCTDIPGGSHLNMNNEADITKSSSLNTSGTTQVQNSDGTVSYQKCETQTPGSAISSSLQKSLGAPVDELDLANDINAVVNAATSVLLTKAMQSGLSSLSNSSNGHVSATQQVIQDANSSTVAQQNVSSIKLEIKTILKQLNSLLALYDPATTTLSTAIANYQSARSCYSSLQSTTTIANQIASIDYTLNYVIPPIENNINVSIVGLQSSIQQLNDISTALNIASSSTDISDQIQRFNEMSSVAGQVTQSTIDDAKTTSASAKAQGTKFISDADSMLKACKKMKLSTTGTI